MAWLDNMIDEWTRKLANGEKVPAELNVYLHMPILTCLRWQKDRPVYVAGSDEVGYGALAGPLVVCAVCAPYDWELKGLKDSKQLKPEKREMLAYELYSLQRAGKIRIALKEVSNTRIDEIGMATAIRRSHCSALEEAGKGIKSLLKVADGSIDFPDDTISIPKADTFIPQVMAASIIAKHVRDNFMKDMADHFPQYGFDTHVGYGTKKHYAAIEDHGACELHRMSYAPFSTEAIPINEAVDGDYPGNEDDVRPVQDVDGAAAQGSGSPAESHADVQPECAAPDQSGGTTVRTRRARKQR
jgi:ribonuclease HII